MILAVAFEMAGIRLLNIFITIENVLCIYRNYSFLRFNMKKLIVLRLTFVTIFYIYTFIEFIKYIFTINFNKDVLTRMYFVNYCVLLYSLSFESIFNSIHKRKSFKNLHKLLYYVHNYCNSGDVYRKSHKKLTLWSIYSVLFLLLNFIISVLNLLRLGLADISSRDPMECFKKVAYACLFPLHEFRFLVELLLFNVIIKMITLSLKHVNAKLSLFVTQIRDVDDVEVIQQKCNQFQKTLEEIAIIYERVAICSTELQKCFSVQVKFHTSTEETYLRFVFVLEKNSR